MSQRLLWLPFLGRGGPPAAAAPPPALEGVPGSAGELTPDALPVAEPLPPAEDRPPAAPGGVPAPDVPPLLLPSSSQSTHVAVGEVGVNTPPPTGAGAGTAAADPYVAVLAAVGGLSSGPPCADAPGAAAEEDSRRGAPASPDEGRSHDQLSPPHALLRPPLPTGVAAASLAPRSSLPLMALNSSGAALDASSSSSASHPPPFLHAQNNRGGDRKDFRYLPPRTSSLCLAQACSTSRRASPGF